MSNNVKRILDRIASHPHTVSVGLLASDLRLSQPTVAKHVKALVTAGRVEAETTEFGTSFALSRDEQHERALDAFVADRAMRVRK